MTLITRQALISLAVGSVLGLECLHRFNDTRSSTALARELSSLVDSSAYRDPKLQLDSAPSLVPPPSSPISESEYIVRRGDTWSEIWKQVGAGDGSRAAGRLVAAGINPKKLRAGDKLTVSSIGGTVISCDWRVDDLSTARIHRSADSDFRVEILRHEVIESERTVTATVTNSFAAAATENGVPYSLVDDFVDLFSNKVEFTKDIQPGDSFSVVFVDRRTADGRQLAPGIIRAASIKLGDSMVAVAQDLAVDGTKRTFDQNGKAVGDYFLRYPVQFTRISSVFSAARFHPVLRRSRPHNGVDFAAPTGTPVRAVGEGTVVFAGYNKGAGNMVRIAHSGGFTTEYMHLSKIASGVSNGFQIGRGQVVGAVGSTGLATGPHLHFGLFKDGRYVDPLESKLPLSPTNEKTPEHVIVALKQLKKNHDSIAVAALDMAGKRNA